MLELFKKFFFFFPFTLKTCHRQKTSLSCFWMLLSEELMLGAVAATLDHEDRTKGIGEANKDIAEPLKEPTPELHYFRIM